MVYYTPTAAIPNRENNVYSAPLKIYRGVDNHLSFSVLNRDQKQQSTADKTLTITLKSVIGETMMYFDLEPRNAERGLYELIIPASDTTAMMDNRYTYTVTADAQPLYLDDAAQAVGQIVVATGIAPNAVQAVEVELVAGTSQLIPTTGSSHTAQIALSEFSGVLYLDVSPVASPGPTDWVTIAQWEWSNESSNQLAEWDAVHSVIRWRTSTVSGSILSILYVPA